ncbi:MAG: hypothetical protein KDE22_18945 [Rhodobacterales bacterium]|nr:hypothetical protein [Rhodobacterales bacterium]
MKTAFVAPLLAAVVLATAGSAAAQDSRYQRWVDPETAQQKETLLEDLRALVDKAERDRAADPYFLRDLRALIQKYDVPALVELLFDDFSDGDFTSRPAWRVTSGQYWIERGYGLRSAVATAIAAQPQEDEKKSKKQQRQELAAALIGSLLGGQQNGGQEPASGGSPTTPPAAVIETRLALPNAFTLDLDVASFKAPGQFEVGVFQGSADLGYRLIYVAGPVPEMQLRRVSSRGSGLIGASSGLAALEDNKVHALSWSRGPDGTMTVRLDGADVVVARDAGFRDPFDGLVLVNGGGDFIVSRVAVQGAQGR